MIMGKKSSELDFDKKTEKTFLKQIVWMEFTWAKIILRP